VATKTSKNVAHQNLPRAVGVGGEKKATTMSFGSTTSGWRCGKRGKECRKASGNHKDVAVGPMPIIQNKMGSERERRGCAILGIYLADPAYLRIGKEVKSCDLRTLVFNVGGTSAKKGAKMWHVFRKDPKVATGRPWRLEGPSPTAMPWTEGATRGRTVLIERQLAGTARDGRKRRNTFDPREGGKNKSTLQSTWERGALGFSSRGKKKEEIKLALI